VLIVRTGIFNDVIFYENTIDHLINKQYMKCHQSIFCLLCCVLLLCLFIKFDCIKYADAKLV